MPYNPISGGKDAYKGKGKDKGKMQPIANVAQASSSSTHQQPEVAHVNQTSNEETWSFEYENADVWYETDDTYYQESDDWYYWSYFSEEHQVRSDRSEYSNHAVKDEHYRTCGIISVISSATGTIALRDFIVCGP